MTDKKDALANLKEKKEAALASDAQVIPAKTAEQAEPEPEPEPEPQVKKAAELYQQYTSRRISMCMVTPNGKRMNFTNYEYYTKDDEIIAYLDGELAAGCKAYTKGQKITADEINPAAALRRKTIEEFKNSQEGRDFSGAGVAAAKAAAGLSGGAGTGMVNSNQVAN